jgi:hypothetical protein
VSEVPALNVQGRNILYCIVLLRWRCPWWKLLSRFAMFRLPGLVKAIAERHVRQLWFSNQADR